MRATVVWCLMLGAASAVTSDADACSIVLPAVLTPSARSAPPNTHVWIHGVPLGPIMSGATFALVSTTDGKPRATTIRSWAASGVWQLVPLERLPAATSFEVWAIPHATKKPVLLGLFRTAADDDVAAPSAPVLTHATLQRDHFAGCPTTVQVMGKPGTDAEGDVLHAVWWAFGDKAIDYASPPAALVRWPVASSFDRMPALEIMPLDQNVRAGSTRVGVRAVDLAGHLGAPAEIALR